MPPAEPAPLYRAYGLLIASALPLPELPVAASVAAGVADVVIRIAALPEVAGGREPAGARRIGPFLWAAADRFWLCVPGIACFRIAAGDEIVVDPDPAGDADGVRTFLLGTALGVLLTQRGQLVLHGSAVRIGNGCVVCTGPSGAGKSTLAAGFGARGFALLTDDLVCVDAANRAVPGIPRIKLWGDVAGMMAINTAALPRVRTSLEKFSLPAHASLAEAPAPVRALYAIAVTNGDAVRLERLRGYAKLRAVRDAAYRLRLIEAAGGRERHLARAAPLAAAASVAGLFRPARGFSLDALIDAILTDLDEPG